MDHGNDRHASHRLGQRALGVGAVDAAGLQTQQCGHCLQVVLHPVVHLFDHRVAGEQLSFAAADLGDVTGEDDRSDPLPFVRQRNRTQGHTRASDFEFGPPWGATGEHERECLVDLTQLRTETRHHLGEVAAFDLSAEPEPMHQRYGIRGSVLHVRIAVEDEDAVSDPGFAVAGPGRGIAVGECSLHDHPHQGHRRFPVVLLQSGRASAADLFRVSDDERDGFTTTDDRHRLGEDVDIGGSGADPHLLGRGDVGDIAAGAAGLVEQLLLQAGRAGSDQVPIEQRCPGRRSGMRQHRIGTAERRHPQHEVGEGEIGQQLPVPDEQMDVFDV